jgi:hypothetical protein
MVILWQLKQALSVWPEHVRHLEWQLEQVVSEALYWFELQSWQESGVGEFGLTFMAMQVLQFDDSGPEQVAQSEWQAVQVFSSLLNSLEAQATHVPVPGWLGFT